MVDSTLPAPFGPLEAPFDPNNRDTQIALLAMRISNLGKEKEDIERNLELEEGQRKDLERRVAVMEGYFQRGRGIVYGLVVLGSLVGFISAYWKSIFAPWTIK